MQTHTHIHIHIHKQIHTYWYIYIHTQIHIYIHIYCHPQTDFSLYHNSSVWQDSQETSSWNCNPPNFTLGLLSYRSAISVTNVSSGILTHFELAFVCLYFALSDTGVPGSLEVLCFTQVEAINSLARVLNPREGGFISRLW